ncbi:uncharacterized protein N7484_002710 [Penicillium longicatenatum]|uniref:uncharacterized protein n=1 Tax=Penicillium longicatenatum TaxID=1561947 RepID=UPI002548FACA|nr:uncharacterized protein N7484_002710 [Penicillium longicatenatum]KAJ5648987.1 hypothetical protein N7484_002710 [Penicillium longicatenatum]
MAADTKFLARPTPQSIINGNGQSVETCMRSCGQNSKCIAGVWYPQERDCWLHTQILSLRIMRSAHVISFAIDKDQV